MTGIELTERDTAYNSDIEALRALAIAITLFAHLAIIVPSWVHWMSFFWLGGGVDLFFAISGFLIVRQLLSLRKTCGSFSSFAIRFWVRRIFRLWPAAIAWSVIALILVVAINPPLLQWNELLKSWVFAVLEVENVYIGACFPSCQSTLLSHYWSLSLEEQFYFFIPFIIFAFRNNTLLAAFFISFAVVQIFVDRPWPSMLWYTRSDALLYGAALALLWETYPRQLKFLFNAVPTTLLRLVGACCLICIVVLARAKWSAHFVGFVAIASGATVATCSANLTLIKRGMLLNILLFIGRRSYSIYLIHFPAFYIVRYVDPGGGPLSIIPAIIATLLLADLSFRYVEMPLRILGRRLSRETHGQPLLAIPPNRPHKAHVEALRQQQHMQTQIDQS